MKVGDLVRRKALLDSQKNRFKFLRDIDTKILGIIVMVTLSEHAQYETYAVNFFDRKNIYTYTKPYLELVSEA